MLAYILGTTKLGNKEIIQIETCFRDYKLGQEGLKNGGYLRDLKSRQRDFKSEQILQIGARENTNRGRDLKLERGLQIGAEHCQWIVYLFNHRWKRSYNISILVKYCEINQLLKLWICILRVFNSCPATAQIHR